MNGGWWMVDGGWWMAIRAHRVSRGFSESRQWMVDSYNR
jgi:hypothetical protein